MVGTGVDRIMLKATIVIFWAIGLIIFGLVAFNGGWAAWVGVIMCALLMFLSILDWGNSDDPNDWSV